MCSKYTIQCTISKLSSNGSVVVKGCDGYRKKVGEKDYNVLVEGTCEKFQDCSTQLKKGGNWGEWEFALLRDAACNNKKVELVILDDYKTIESVTILA